MHIRDFFKVYINEELRDVKIKDLQEDCLFEALCVPETCDISSLFRQMKQNKSHMSVVVDEYGQTSGIVTMEDILEEIVGDILDEYDEEESEDIVSLADGTYVIDGQTSLETIEEKFGISFNCEDIDTINGFMLSSLGKIPEAGEKFDTEIGNICFSIMEVKDRMITKVKASPNVDIERQNC